MSRDSENRDVDRVRQLVDGVHLSTDDLIRQTGSQEPKNHSEGDVSGDRQIDSEACSELVSWIEESEENRATYESAREFDRNLANVLSEVTEFEPGLEERIRCLVHAEEFEEIPDEQTDYQALFDASDLRSKEIESNPGSQLELAGGKGSELSTSPNRRAAAWWLGTIGTLATTAAIIMVAFWVQIDRAQPEAEFTAEMLCNDSLKWNPNRVAEEWSSDMKSAPANRAFPSHLIRLQARSWKKIEIEGDQQGVVYNLIPGDNLAEPKAYLYVFKSDRDFQLPGQFASHATSNRKYRFWSVACRQDLVFVLVYEGEEKRLHDLIKIQQVG